MPEPIFNTVITDPASGNAKLTYVPVGGSVGLDIQKDEQAWGIVDPAGTLVSVRSLGPTSSMNAVEALARAWHEQQHPTFDFDPVNRTNTEKLRECSCMARGDDLIRVLGDLRFRVVAQEVIDDGRRP